MGSATENVPAIVTSHEPDGERVPSDTESHEAIEVIFDSQDIYRRKSSLVPSAAPKKPANNRRHTQCFVHSLLEEDHSTFTLEQPPIYEGLAQERQTHQDPLLAERDDHQSRLLTKRQISDMAYGIRELAKKLAHIKVKIKIHNIFLLAKAHDPTLINNAREVTNWLLTHDANYRVWVEDTMEQNEIFDLAGLIKENESYKKRVRFWDAKLCAERPQTFDIVLALGGDGTVLYASWLFQRIVPPVLAFALGSLGFLTKFDYSLFPKTLSQAFADGITVSLRLRFEATVMRCQPGNRTHPRDLVEEIIGEEAEDNHTHRPDGTHNILNEVVLDRGPNATMSTIELFGDGDHFTTILADGICIATPTGSTAYNLAAGGSLCHPENPVILVTAICAHTLSFRPIILPDTIVLRAGVPYDARTSSWASFDGRERVELCPGDYVTISASRFPFPSVLPLDGRGKDWVESISRTLQWNSRQRQKAFKD